MKRYRTVLFAGLAAVGLALAGCGGGDGGLSTSEEQQLQDEKKMVEEQVAALRAVIADLEEQLGLEPGGNIGDSIDDLQARADDLADQLTEEKRKAAEAAAAAAEEKRKADEAAAEAARMAAAKTGKDLFAALGGAAAAGTNALSNVEVTDTDLSNGLTIDAASRAGTFDDDPDDEYGVTLKAGDSAGALGGWAGTNYALTTGTGASKITNEAVVYTNKGPARSVSFADAGHAVDTSGANEGYLTTVVAANAMATAFTHSGTQTHPIPDRSNALYIRGTYDGAPGEYRCTGTCTSTNDGKGSPRVLDGTWHFKPDAGAMVSQPDATYLYYGWWVNKDKDGDPTAASAFTGTVGDSADITAITGAAGGELTGSATYVGNAAGKFALDYSQNKAANGASDGGHFTAAATLNATFGSGATAGMTGTIDNFMANGESVPWSVALHRAGWGRSGAITAPTDDGSTTDVNEALATTWSIDGTSAPASGTWSGQMYDEMPGNPPNGDGSNIPTTVTGTFYSEFSDVGRMVGAFGANKQ
jgi:hypothetical protein